MIRWLSRWRMAGPGLVVTAAFIGPGTVTTASKAGAKYGYQLLWVLVVATLATIFLQNMAARVGLVTRVPLGIAIMESLKSQGMRWFVGVLAVFAIGFGNSAFQAGNLTGARIGLEIIAGSTHAEWVYLIAGMAMATLFMSSYKRIEFVLIAMVAFMSVGFLATAVLIRPEPSAVGAGLLPTVPKDSVLVVLGLLGTTIVPYNLFLHAGLVQRKWNANDETLVSIAAARADSALAIGLGGLVSAAILVTAAVAYSGAGVELKSAADMPAQLAPLLGHQVANLFFGVGLLAAGLTSAITAPLAAAMAISGLFGWGDDPKALRFRVIWLGVMGFGLVVARIWNNSPMEIIVVAQAANGLLLPVMVALLILVSHKHPRLSAYRPAWWENLAAVAVLALVLVLSGNFFRKLFES
ncbi:MAG: Nramp family divalent metal transporter [Planctomycetaceae bacterium]|nr:Nramp family divalent metal transporter [Planctomycetaceae bacterium]